MDFDELYSSIRAQMKAFKKKNYWNSFSAADIFYIADERTSGLFTFIDQFFGDSFGCQLFSNRRGFNYVHDILTVNDEETVYFWDCDSICGAFIDKDKLTKKDIEFLKKHKIRIQKENNLILYRFEPGFEFRCCNTREMKKFNDFLAYVSSLIENEFDDIIEGFKKGLIPLAVIDNENYTYSFMLRDLPYLEMMPNRQKPNEKFAEEFKDSTYLDDECYMYTSYLPVVIRETGIRPMLVYFYFPNTNKCYIKYIIDKPREYKNCIYGILYDLFTNVGLPTKMYINNRELFRIIENTLKAIKIESKFIREYDSSYNNVKDLISSVYKNSIEEVVESRDFVELFMQAITDIVNDSIDEENIVEDKLNFGNDGLVS